MMTNFDDQATFFVLWISPVMEKGTHSLLFFAKRNLLLGD
jgi:hypothetical protein